MSASSGVSAPVTQPLYAHSANDQGERQALVDHLRGVAKLAREMAEPFGAGDLAFLAGLWHDAGKADPLWQKYLIACEEGSRNSVGIDHKCAGVLLAERAAGGLAERAAGGLAERAAGGLAERAAGGLAERAAGGLAERAAGGLAERAAGGNAAVVGLLIHGHHGGLRNQQDYAAWLKKKRELPGPEKALQALRAALPTLESFDPPKIPDHVQRDALAAEFFIRFAYSALIDADSLDTEAHKLGEASSARRSDIGLTELWQRYCSFLTRELAAPDSVVNIVRREVYEACIEAASEKRGIFRLTVPTGGGKTRSAMAFALCHGIRHGLRRVIVAVPFTTITHQTADVYRRIFGDDRVVLEHHSAIAEGYGAESDDDDTFTEEAVWRRLAAENWDAPVIVTTTVQLFESIFSNRRSKTRKLHNLADSVIILDEAQALPASLLAPILDALRSLTEHYGASVVLSTATQPTFECIKEFREVEAREIVHSHADHFNRLRRVDWEWKTNRPHSWGEIAERMRCEHQVLAIVNTKHHAMELLSELQQTLGDDHPASGGGIMHLSTLLCGEHRANVLREIKRRLMAGDPCLLVSTQVVEAGVDLDFPAVFRAEAPLDALIQAAGRCNREGKLNVLGRVVVFKPPDDSIPPGFYETGRDTTRVMRNTSKFNPDDPQTTAQYFELLFGVLHDPDKKKIQRLRKHHDFPAVAKKFRMIDEDVCDVIVNYPDVSRIDQLLDQIGNPGVSTRKALRAFQPYTVSLRRHKYERLKVDGLIEEIAWFRDVGRWLGDYDDVRGLSEAEQETIF